MPFNPLSHTTKINKQQHALCSPKQALLCAMRDYSSPMLLCEHKWHFLLQISGTSGAMTSECPDDILYIRAPPLIWFCLACHASLAPIKQTKTIRSSWHSADWIQKGMLCAGVPFYAQICLSGKCHHGSFWVSSCCFPQSSLRGEFAYDHFTNGRVELICYSIIYTGYSM